MITFEAIGYEAVEPARALSLNFLLLAIMLGALYASATSFNDITDEEIDKVNLANDISRPLVTTDTTKRQLKRFGIFALFIAAFAGMLVGPAYIFFVVAGTVLSVCYSLPPFKISHRGFLAALWLPISYVGLPFFAGAFLHGYINKMSVYVFLSMYICFIGRILLKDFRDYEGDKKFGKLNYLVRHGAKKTCRASAIAWLVGDFVFCLLLGHTFLVVCILIQPTIALIVYCLYLLSIEKDYSKKLLEVLFVGRMGNAVALALLTALTLRAFDYPETQKNLTVLAVGIFMAVSAVGLWKDDALREELKMARLSVSRGK